MEMESDDDIFIQKEIKQEKPKKERKRKPREMSEETRERMAAILAKGRETRLKNNQLKKEALENDKQKIKETLKSKLKEVKKQLKEELVNESIGKKKNECKIKSSDNVEELFNKELEQNSKKQPITKDDDSKNTKLEPVSVPQEHKYVNPEPPKSQPKEPVAEQQTVKSEIPKQPASAPIPIPKPNLTAEYMRKLRAAYNF